MVDSCVILGMQRAGNHLVMSILSELGLIEFDNFIKYTNDNIMNMPLNNHYSFASHMKYCKNSKILNKFKGIYISRNIKDVIISQAIMFFKNKDLNESIIFIIKNIKKKINDVTKWKLHQNVLHVKFENLIGDKGNGSEILQEKEIIKICKHLNIKYSKNLINNCKNNMFGKTKFFNKGKIGNYKHYFNKELNELYKKKVGL